MKVEIELNMPDTRIFLDFWNWHNGDDVICELKNDKLFLTQYDDEGKELPEKEITLTEFCQLVKTKVDEMKLE